MTIQELEKFDQLPIDFHNPLLLKSSKLATLFGGLLVFTFALILLFVTYENDLGNGKVMLMPHYIYLFRFLGSVLLVFSVILFATSFHESDPFKKKYDPGKEAHFLLGGALFFTLFMFAFCSICLSVSWYEKSMFVGVISICMLTCVTWGAFKGMKRVSLLLKNAKDFGVSEIQLETDQLRIGSALKGVFKNKSRMLGYKKLDVRLRNLAERSIRAGKHRTKDKTFIISETIGAALLENGQAYFDLPIPSFQTLPTHLESTVANYWMLEFAYPQREFYARFILKVQ